MKNQTRDTITQDKQQYGKCVYAGRTYVLAEQARPSAESMYYAVAYDVATLDRVIVAWYDDSVTQYVYDVTRY